MTPGYFYNMLVHFVHHKQVVVFYRSLDQVTDLVDK